MPKENEKEKEEHKKPETIEEAVDRMQKHIYTLEGRMGSLEDLVLETISPAEATETIKPKPDKRPRCPSCNHRIDVRKKCPYCGALPKRPKKK